MPWLLKAALIIAVIHQSTAKEKRSKEASEPVDVNDLCREGACPSGQYCRVVEKCGKKRVSTFQCLSCAPIGADDICNAHQYKRAVLGGSKKDPTPLACDLDNIENKFECPLGSDCMKNPDSPGHGVCCYGHVNPLLGKVSSGDLECSPCKDKCRPGYTCQEDVRCGALEHMCKATA